MSVSIIPNGDEEAYSQAKIDLLFLRMKWYRAQDKRRTDKWELETALRAKGFIIGSPNKARTF